MINHLQDNAKQNMLRAQIREQFMLNDHLMMLLAESSRDAFVPKAYQALAFADMHIPLGLGQVMMTPNEEARMLAALSIQSQDSILEIGTGTGYVTSLLAKLGKTVTSFEVFPEFVTFAKNHISQLGLNNVTILSADASSYDFTEKYDVICLSASTPLLPKKFITLLKPGGRLFAIVGTAPAMTATLIKRSSTEKWYSEGLFETVLPEMLHVPKPSSFQF